MAIKPDGHAAKIVALRKGETYSVTKRLLIRSVKPEDIRAAREHLKNYISPYADRARKETGATFSAETAVAYTYDYAAVLVTVAVTRLTADKAA